jgi:hypothetical protein
MLAPASNPARRGVPLRRRGLVAASLAALLLIVAGEWIAREPGTSPMLISQVSANPPTIRLNGGERIGVPGVILRDLKSGGGPSRGGAGNRISGRDSTVTQPLPFALVQDSASGIQEKPVLPEDTMLAQSEVPKQQIPVPPPIVGGVSQEPGIFATAFRPGVSYIGRGDGAVSTEVNLRLDARLGQGHRLSLVMGRGASVLETRHQSTGIYVSRVSPPTGSSTPAPELVSVRPYQMEVKQELWAGVGYNYTLALGKFGVGIGGVVGSGADAWRLGVELPVSYRITDRISVEAAAQATHILPHNGSVTRFTVDNSADGLLYQGETARPEFTSVGGELGIRVDLP